MTILYGVLLVSSCKREPEGQIVGAYAQERKTERTEDGRVLGTITTRDTIFVTKKKEGYQIENRIWKFRDYDKEGWVRLSTHDGVRFTHVCTYDETDHSLNPVMSGMFLPAYLNLDKGLLAFDKEFAYPWKKIKP